MRNLHDRLREINTNERKRNYSVWNLVLVSNCHRTCSNERKTTGVHLKAQDILSPDCRRKKTELTINTKRISIVMTDCLQAGCRITRQYVIAIFFLYWWWARVFPPVVYLGSKTSFRIIVHDFYKKWSRFKEHRTPPKRGISNGSL